MIVVRIELWPKGFKDEKRELATIAIANVGGTSEIADYRYAISHQVGTPSFQTLDPHKLLEGVGVWKRGFLRGFQRHLGAVILVRNVLRRAFL